MNNELKCPHCGSDKFHSAKKGFSGANAVVGFILLFIIFSTIGGIGDAIIFGLLGLFAGTIGSNEIFITCLACSKVYKPGAALKKDDSVNWLNVVLYTIIFLVAGFMVYQLFIKTP